MSPDVTVELIKTVPALSCVCLFGLVMFRLLATEAQYYRKLLDDSMGRVLSVLERLDERTELCLRQKEK